MPHLLTVRQQGCVAGRLPPAHERRLRSGDPMELQASSTKPLGIAGGSGGRAKHAAAPSCRCAIAPPSTARAALAGRSWLGRVINRARVARRVEDGSSTLEPSPRCGTTRRSATGWCACRVALCAMRSCRSRSGGSTPPGLGCTGLRATSSPPTTHWKTAAKTTGREVRRSGGGNGPAWRGLRASADDRFHARDSAERAIGMATLEQSASDGAGRSQRPTI